MKYGKLITGLAVGAIAALIIIPKTRKMLSDAVDQITDSFRDMMDNAGDMAQKGQKEANKLADKAKEVAGAVKTTKEAWQQ